MTPKSPIGGVVSCAGALAWGRVVVLTRVAMLVYAHAPLRREPQLAFHGASFPRALRRRARGGLRGGGVSLALRASRRRDRRETRRTWAQMHPLQPAERRQVEGRLRHRVPTRARGGISRRRRARARLREGARVHALELHRGEGARRRGS